MQKPTDRGQPGPQPVRRRREPLHGCDPLLQRGVLHPQPRHVTHRLVPAAPAVTFDGVPAPLRLCDPALVPVWPFRGGLCSAVCSGSGGAAAGRGEGGLREGGEPAGSRGGELFLLEKEGGNEGSRDRL
jgi:hypothetical protein